MMSTKVTHPDPMLADNDKTVAFLKEMVGEDEAKIAVIEEWGKKRQVRIEKLRRFVGLLEQNDLLREERRGADGDCARTCHHASALRSPQKMA